MKRLTYLLVVLVISSSVILSQNNPYPEFVPYVTEDGKQLVEDTNTKSETKVFGEKESARWLSVDPMATKYPGWSPYNYTLCNPINIIDPDGDSTFVIANDDGTYTVNGGHLSGANDDTGIYTKNSDGTATLIANSLTTHSFFGNKGKAVVGAVINMSSSDGQNFLIREIVNANPFIGYYMLNAGNGGKYDFKDRGIDKRPSGMSESAYHYRGSITAGGRVGSARDFGNMAAGVVAGRAGLSWETARFGFDYYNSRNSDTWAVEPPTTQKAQKIGYKIGTLLKRVSR